MTLADVIAAIDSEIFRVQQARDLLAEKGAVTRPGRPARVSIAKRGGKRTLSTEGRKRIAAAQRKRWAAKRKSAK